MHKNMTRNNEITARRPRDYGSLTTRLRLVTSLLLMLLLGTGAWGQTEISDVTGLNNMTVTGSYIITDDIDASDYSATISNFSGTLTAQANADGTFPVISGLRKPLFNSINGGTVSNIMLKDVNINSSTNVNVGAVAATAQGSSYIYNCGVLPTTTVRDNDGNITGFTGSSFSTTTSNEVGSIVGKIQNATRVINCFSYANITGGKNVAGIVGYAGNTNITQDNYSETPMVMNCMFYGEITGGTYIRPVYGGKSINNNATNGVNPYNYFRANAKFDENYTDIGNYNRSWPAEEEYLTRFESAAVDADDLHFCISQKFIEESCSDDVGVPSRKVDVDTAVTAVKPPDSEVVNFVCSGNLSRSIAHFDFCVSSACAADRENAFVFGVDVEEDLSFEPARFKCVRAGKAGLFVDREEKFERRMNNIFIGCKEHTHCKSDTVVSAERRAVSLQPFAVNDAFDRIFAEIVAAASDFFADHVHVTLDNDCRFVFVAGSCWSVDENVHRLVSFSLETVFFSPFYKPFADFFFVFALSRNLVEFCKKIKNCLNFVVHFFLQNDR